MKLRIIDRILMALSGLILLALGVWIALDALGMVMPLSEVLAWLRNVNSVQKGLFIAGGCAVLALLGVYDVSVLFRRGKGKHGFIAQRSENGEISISVKSIESLVYKCAQKHGEIKVQSVSVEETRSGLLIKLRANLASGMNIPLAVGTLQRQVRQYITACSGVDVSEVRVKVESNDRTAEDSPYAVPEAPAALPVEEPVPEPIPAEAVAPVEVPVETPEAPAAPEERPAHQRMFSTVEEPNIVPAPPAQDVPPEEMIAQEAEQAAAEAAAQAEQEEAQWEETAAQAEQEESHWDEITAQVEQLESQWEAVTAQAEEQGAQWEATAAEAEPEEAPSEPQPDEAAQGAEEAVSEQEETPAADDADSIG